MSNWIEWKWSEGKQYPETLDTFVYVKFANGSHDEWAENPWSVRDWYDPSRPEWSNWFNIGFRDASIIAYKVVES